MVVDNKDIFKFYVRIRNKLYQLEAESKEDKYTRIFTIKLLSKMDLQVQWKGNITTLT